MLRDAPQVYLRFDDLKADRNKTALDATGNYHGTVAGNLASGDGAPGTGGRAATFDGRSSLASISISLHYWQGDDVAGFEQTEEAIGGGLAVTGNYPEFPGGEFQRVERDRIGPEHFQGWIDWG